MAVERDDARRLLAAMLQGMQSKSRDGGGGGMAENSENSAFLPQTVGVEVKIEAAGTGILAIQRPSAKIKALSGVLRFTHRQPLQSFNAWSSARAAPRQTRLEQPGFGRSGPDIPARKKPGHSPRASHNLHN